MCVCVYLEHFQHQAPSFTQDTTQLISERQQGLGDHNVVCVQRNLCVCMHVCLFGSTPCSNQTLRGVCKYACMYPNVYIHSKAHAHTWL